MTKKIKLCWCGHPLQEVKSPSLPEKFEPGMIVPHKPLNPESWEKLFDKYVGMLQEQSPDPENEKTPEIYTVTDWEYVKDFIRKVQQEAVEEERRRAAEIVAQTFPAVYTHLSGHKGMWVREEYMLKMKKEIEKKILDSQ